MSFPVVGDFMDTRVPTVRPDTDILEAVESLLKNHVTGAPVVDDAGHVIGMLTEKDCLKLIATGHGADVPRGTVESFMETEITTITPDTDIYFAAGLFLRNSFRRLPVVEGGRLIGAVTRFDILRVILANLR
ncbi:MAG: CBS domain-containing protein [Myxococcota bacterium]